MEITLLLTKETELSPILKQLNEFARAERCNNFGTYEASNHGQWTCLTLTTSASPHADVGATQNLKTKALELLGVYEECPECAKRKKWGSAWQAKAQPQTT